MSEVSGSRITHNYANIRGVDFTDEEVSINRSPSMLNMWKNYHKLGKCIETRPGLKLLKKYDYEVFGMHFYKVGNREMLIVHSGVYLYKEENGIREQIFSGLNPKKSSFFLYDNILYLLDGIKYLQYDGVEVKEVEGFIPTTTISMSPQGNGTPYQNVNLLTGIRKNSFCGDGKSKEYVLDSHNEYIDSDYRPIVKINDIINDNFTVDYAHGIITFVSAPPEPLTVGQDNVEITFKRTIPGYRERINKCTLYVEFDNRIFFAGNPDYPTTLFHSELYDPTYIDDQNYYTEGTDDSLIKSLVTGNNALWVFKEPSQSNNGVFYHTPSIYNDQKAYTSTHSSISTGCRGLAINFGDDICFFSDRGMEAITSDITTEQMLSHRSFLIDSKLLREKCYEKMILAEWEGYLLVCIDNHIYLADSNQNYSNSARYEWFYWEFDSNVTSMLVKDNILYVGTKNSIYSLTDFSEDRNIKSYFMTSYDEFGYPQYQKTTNKRGSVVDIVGEYIQVYVSTDNKEFEFNKAFDNVNGYAVNKIKKKKWKGIQLKFESSKPFKLFSCTLEAYVGGYLKR